MIESLTFDRQNNADWVQQLQLNNYNASTNRRTPFNLSGVEAKLLLVGASSAHPSLLLSTINGLLIIPSSGDLGEMIIQVPAAMLWTLTGGVYSGDCLLFLPGGGVTLAFTVELTLEAGTTPPTP
jgi:hypothetical protein